VVACCVPSSMWALPFESGTIAPISDDTAVNAASAHIANPSCQRTMRAAQIRTLPRSAYSAVARYTAVGIARYNSVNGTRIAQNAALSFAIGSLTDALLVTRNGDGSAFQNRYSSNRYRSNGAP